MNNGKQIDYLDETWEMEEPDHPPIQEESGSEVDQAPDDPGVEYSWAPTPVDAELHNNSIWLDHNYIVNTDQNRYTLLNPNNEVIVENKSSFADVFLSYVIELTKLNLPDEEMDSWKAACMTLAANRDVDPFLALNKVKQEDEEKSDHSWDDFLASVNNLLPEDQRQPEYTQVDL